MRKKRVVCIILALIAIGWCSFSVYNNKFPDGDFFDKAALRYMELKWLKKPEGILKEEDNADANKKNQYYSYTASLTSAEYYLDYVNSLFSELLTRYKYVTYMVDSESIPIGPYESKYYRYVARSKNLYDYLTISESLTSNYYVFSAYFSQRTYYSEEEQHIKLKNDTYIIMSFYLPITEDDYAINENSRFNIIVKKNQVFEYLVWDKNLYDGEWI